MMKTIDIRQISKIPELRIQEGPKDSYKCLFCQNKPKSNLGREKKHIHFVQHMQICNGNRGESSVHSGYRPRVLITGDVFF